MATIQLKRSATPAGVPAVGDLALGELAVNTYDGKLYLKKNNGSDSIVEIGGGGGGASVHMATTPPGSPASGNLWYNTELGIMFVYYVDANSSQWVPSGPSSAGAAGISAVKFTANIGNGVNTSYTITHNLNTRDVGVFVYENSGSYVDKIPDIERPTVNTINVIFAVAPTTNQYRVVIVA